MEEEEKKEKAMVRSAPDGSDNQTGLPKVFNWGLGPHKDQTAKMILI